MDSNEEKIYAAAMAEARADGLTEKEAAKFAKEEVERYKKEKGN
jgi:hypothetical protein